MLILRLALSLLGVVVDTMVAGYTDRRRLFVFHASFLHIMWAAIFALSFWRAYHTIHSLLFRFIEAFCIAFGLLLLAGALKPIYSLCTGSCCQIQGSFATKKKNLIFPTLP